MSSSTAQFISNLESLKEGDLSLLRTHQNQRLDESLLGFDVFTGLWWPLRSKNQAAPRREIAWLISKLYAFSGIRHQEGIQIARTLGKVCRAIDDENTRNRFIDRFDDMLNLDLELLEFPLQMALLQMRDKKHIYIDWVRLTDELSKWESESTRSKWAQEFYQAYKNIDQEEKC